MNHQGAQQLVIRTARLFGKYNSDESAILSALEEEGHSSVEARKLYRFVQSAFAWALLKKLGVEHFPSEFEVRFKQGTFAVPVASQHLFTAALAVAHGVLQKGYTREITQGTFEAVISHSAEVNAANRALNEGVDISGSEIKTVFFDFEPCDFGLESKSWWQFWR